MGSRLLLPLLLVAALVASVLFWLLSSSDIGRDSDLAPRGGAVTALEGRDEGALARPGELPAADRAETVERRSVPETAPKVDAAVEDEVAEGARLMGSVRDRLGNPVAGARVLAGSGGFQVSFDFDSPFGGREETLTDAEGRFEFADLAPGDLHLGVRAAGFAPFERTDLVLPADDVHRLDPITLTLGAILSGHVLDDEGAIVAGAELFRLAEDGPVSLFPGSGREPVAVSAADGSFRIDQLELGEWNVLVRTEDHPDGRFRGLTERSGEEVSGLEFVLDPGTTIEGSVTGIPEAERGLLVVTARKANADWLDYGTRTAEVDASGRFQLRGVALETEYELGVRLQETDRLRFFGGPGRSRSASVRAWAGEDDIEILYQPEAALVFQVVDAATRQPIELFEVEGGVEWTRTLREDNGRPKKLHEDGRVRFGDLRPQSADDRVELIVRAAGYRDFRREGIALATGQELDLGQIFLESVPVVTVTALDAATGTPVSGAVVTLEKEQSGGERSFRVETSISDDGHVTVETGDARAVTNDHGVATLTSPGGETVTLRVESEDHAPYSLGGILLPVGESVARTVELTPGGAVVVTVLDPEGVPVAGVRVSHRGPSDPMGMLSGFPMMGGAGPRHVTDSEGVVRFEQLESGTHRFQIADSSGGGAFRMGGGEVAIRMAGSPTDDEDWSAVDVLEGGEAQLTLSAAARGSLEGRVLEAGKVLTGASVSLREKSASESPMPGMFGGGGPKARTDGDGEFFLEGLEEGEYTLKVEHPTRRMPMEFEVEVRPGGNRFDMDLPVSILEGRILDTNGDPLSDLTVSAERKREGEQQAQRFAFIIDDGDGAGGGVFGGEDLGESTSTDADGRYSLRGVTPDVELVVVASGSTVQEGRSDGVTVGSGDTVTGVDLTLEEAGSVVVEVLAADGSPGRFTMVTATYAGEGDAGGPEMSFTNDDGIATLTGLKPGPWKLSAQRPGQGGLGPATESSVEIRSGEEASAPIRME